MASSAAMADFAFALFCLLAVSGSAAGRRSFARFLQRGDQGPDVITELGSSSSAESASVVPIGGPNVCRSSQGSSFCCPGWTIRGVSGLCLVPKCRARSCGTAGRCIKPNLCLCQGGKISPTCQENTEETSFLEGCRSTCLNGGTCSNGTCSCRTGYTGEYCQEPVCSDPCENGGRCIGPSRCACVYGYTGRTCEIDYRTGPCYRTLSGDTCSDQLEGVVCTRQLCCATVGQAWGHPCARCGDDGDLACSRGFLKNAHTGSCMDINECEAVPGEN